MADETGETPESSAEPPETESPKSVNRRVVDWIMMGPPGRRRQLQDSPVLPDVWFAFTENHGERQELLLTPHMKSSAASVAVSLARNLVWEIAEDEPAQRKITPLHGVVAASLSFTELVDAVIPMTQWWRNLAGYSDEKYEVERLAWNIVQRMDSELGRYPIDPESRAYDLRAQDAQFLYLCGLVMAAPDGMWGTFTENNERLIMKPAANQAVFKSLLRLLENLPAPAAPAREKGKKKSRMPEALVWSISQNRSSEMALRESVPAIKADATRNLFNIDCSKITWAVIDSGIDEEHPAFRDCDTDSSRIVATYDFACIREVANVDYPFLPPADRKKRLNALANRYGLKTEEIDGILKKLAADMELGMELNWDLIEPFLAAPVKTDSYRLEHGTHVAGIIGADWKDEQDGSIRLQGVCPDIRIYDMRVIGDDLVQTESALIAAMQFIRHINSRTNRQVIHGANISLSIPHNVRNYACGSTPVCVEAEALASNGVCVVAAAGNRGYQNFETADGPVFASYAAFSITDPGNAESIITVGSTHRNWPHTYGVSFFSSRGPTGDGRLKPDLVAPGEKIRSTAPDAGEAVMDGTSMAAPHVSGAAALLMARYPEMIGQTARIKQVLKDNATDLGRERSFQGAGMLDILRSIQAV